jgi:hypothetical protein
MSVEEAIGKVAAACRAWLGVSKSRLQEGFEVHVVDEACGFGYVSLPR